MASFKRMRQFEQYGDQWLVDALRTSKVLEVDEKGENVKRTAPLVERPRETIESRSVYAVSSPLYTQITH
jgi:lupus La protein